MQGLKVLQGETKGISKGREGHIWETEFSLMPLPLPLQDCMSVLNPDTRLYIVNRYNLMNFFAKDVRGYSHAKTCLYFLHFLCRK